MEFRHETACNENKIHLLDTKTQLNTAGWDKLAELRTKKQAKT